MYLILTLFVALCITPPLQMENEKVPSVKNHNSFYVESSDTRIYRNHANSFIEINSAAILRDRETDKEIDQEAKLWDEIHQSVSKLPSNSAIHVRFYIPTDIRGIDVSVLKTTIKRKLADINVYISCVDSQYRNDSKPWSEYLAEK